MKISTLGIVKILLVLLLGQMTQLRADDATDRRLIVGKWETWANLGGRFEFRANGTSSIQTFDDEWTIKDGKLYLRNKWIGTTVPDYVLFLEFAHNQVATGRKYEGAHYDHLQARESIGVDNFSI